MPMVRAHVKGRVRRGRWHAYGKTRRPEAFALWRQGCAGIPGIPVANFAGWLVVASVMMAVLAQLPRLEAPSGVPTLMLSWVYISNIFANVAFWDRPAVALWGGVLMGIVLIPWWLRGLRRGRHAEAPAPRDNVGQPA